MMHIISALAVRNVPQLWKSHTLLQQISQRSSPRAKQFLSSDNWLQQSMISNSMILINNSSNSSPRCISRNYAKICRRWYVLAFKLCFGHRDANDNEKRICRDFLGRYLDGECSDFNFRFKKRTRLLRIIKISNWDDISSHKICHMCALEVSAGYIVPTLHLTYV